MQDKVFIKVSFHYNKQKLAMSSSWLKQLSKIDIRTKHTVHGWIRKAEQELQIGYIPNMIRSICIIYIRDDDIFEVTSDKIKLSKHNKMITKIGDAARYD